LGWHCLWPPNIETATSYVLLRLPSNVPSSTSCVLRLAVCVLRSACTVRRPTSYVLRAAPASHVARRTSYVFRPMVHLGLAGFAQNVKKHDFGDERLHRQRVGERSLPQTSGTCFPSLCFFLAQTCYITNISILRLSQYPSKPCGLVVIKHALHSKILQFKSHRGYLRPKTPPRFELRNFGMKSVPDNH